MTSRLVDQLKFSRSEFERSIAGVSEEDGLLLIWQTKKMLIGIF